MARYAQRFAAVHQQSQRWLATGVFEALAQDRAEVGKVDQGYTGENAAEAAKDAGSRTLRRQAGRSKAMGGRAFIRLGDAMQAARKR